MNSRRSYRSLSEINITSLVDVMMCLLIIFMMTAPYIQGGVEVKLPEAHTREVIVQEGPVISITAGRQIYFDDRPVTMSELAQKLGGFVDKKATIPIYLRADETIPYGFVLKVMAAIEKQGFANLALMANQET